MKTVEVVAKGLAYDIALFWCKEQHEQCDKADELIPLISQALTGYAKETFPDAFARDQNGYLKARAEALKRRRPK